MSRKLAQIKTAIVHKMDFLQGPFIDYAFQHWPKVIFLGIALFLILKKDVSINLNLNSAMASTYDTGGAEDYYTEAEDVPHAMNTSQLERGSKRRLASDEHTDSKKKENGGNLANTFSNLIFSKKETISEEERIAREEKRKKQLAYVERYAKIARGEMEKFGIPASITLAQGLLESNVGESRLAKKNNNHFGIKCFSKKCSRGHCSNFEDDSHKDFFRQYKSAWDSFRAHSQLLQGERYKKLYSLDNDDYEGWAYGLKKAGYATDKTYAEKLIGLIEDLELHKYD